MNLDDILEYITADHSNCSEVEKQKKCSQVRTIAAGAGAALALVPMPFADIWTITPVQYLMVRAIGNIYGYKISENSVGEIVAVIGGGFLGQQTILALFKIGLPGAGGFFGSAFVYGWTFGMGKSAELYFASGMTATKDDLKRARESGAKEGEKTYRENEVKDAELKSRIQNMLKMGLNKEQIIYAIWNVTASDNTYEKFEIEFRRLTDSF
ncbi:DUF697 domain-containing protein [Pseudanabaena sp. FACHB-1998]|uniref:YcjF family protein n=1 Tax=Pseudanabaena sp. FACHB-1998 TaxID=2692858 RepID=UPI001680D7A4|nr:DUF697 domain-containing protein [Pseudanabaena sp. FACHB-1998]MBD2177018.1 DUF697 domain-containing protein [Pseudanabaena sp. FACHB-1998]